uniref:Protein kinase domain-containing protein n=1 Tax=Romanomermis culicivorax TaxID=13658 RepID=A0A915L3U5_ROMCU
EYISQNGFVHRDLAARNVLVDEDHNVKVNSLSLFSVPFVFLYLLFTKVCDFGLCRELESDQLYYTSKGGKLPVKWMALESITEYKFTVASDVWSFGILLFELFTLGNVPYPGIDAKLMECYLSSGKRIAKPENCTDEL